MNLQDIKQINNNIPGIDTYMEYGINPTLKSPYTHYELPLYQTRDTLMDIDLYKNFLENAISRFRKSRTYSKYKGFLIGLGLDRCQVHGNITNEMATIEMHHNMLTIYDIALIICEHILNTRGYISTFDLVTLLKKEHTLHHVQVIMLSLTPHQLYHNTDELFFHPDQCVGNWYAFIDNYYSGITMEIAYKLIYHLTDAIEKGGSDVGRMLELREKIKDWSGLI